MKSITRTECAERRALSELRVTSDQIPFALGWIEAAQSTLVERLDALLAYPGDKRTLLTSLTAIRDDIIDKHERLQRSLDAGAPKGGAA
jgi:hypothetical protein